MLRKIGFGFLAIVISSLSILQNIPINYLPHAFAIEDSCITFDSKTRLISISCKIASLSDVDRKLNNASILRLENPSSETSEASPPSSHSKNIWILNAGIVIEKNATLVIDSNDTSWLKIVPVATMQQHASSNLNLTEQNKTEISVPFKSNSNNESESESDARNRVKGVFLVSKNNGDNPNGIHVFGSLIIDSVKITSWNPEKNDVIKFNMGKRAGEELTKSNYDTIEPRPFIRVSEKATGTTNITNSELSYLGYSCSRCSGISFYGGIGSILKGNDIHHLLKGFYSNGMGHMIIEGNHFHDNYLYGIDPHTGSHDIIIRDNIVNDNNASGIICSKYCLNILIEGNEVYKNDAHGSGIMFSIHMRNSTARNNHVHDQRTCISFERSSNYNNVYNNTISDCSYAINLANTTNNQVYNNTIWNSINGISFQNTTNVIRNNQFWNTTNHIVVLKRLDNEQRAEIS